MKALLSSALGLGLALCLSGQAMAQDSATNVSQATGDSTAASAKLTTAGVMAIVGVVALPIIDVAAAAESTGHAASEPGKAAWASANAPLDISPETVVAQPAPNVPYDAQATQPTQKTDKTK